jgi:ABC-type lipopolysaccharide export system ATPase subunit
MILSSAALAFPYHDSLGPHGAGKTTTIKMIAGLIAPERGTDPAQRVRRGPAAEPRGAADRCRAGRLPQRVLAAVGVAEPALLRRPQRAARHADQATAQQLLTDLDLRERRHHRPTDHPA